MATADSDNSIEHLGIIREINPRTIKVSLLNVSGCATCHTKATCTVSDVDNKIIDVINTGQNLKAGDPVKVVLQKSLGPIALFLGYLVPFLVLITVLIAAWIISANEVLSGIAALLSVAVYYSGLTLFRQKLKDTFTFTLLKG